MQMWLNGELTESGQIGADSAGILLGWGVFSTIGIRDQKPLLLEKHFARLQRDAAACGIAMALSEAELGEALDTVLTANQVINGTARITVTQRADDNWSHQSGTDISILAHESKPLKTEALSLYAYPHDITQKGRLAGVKTTSYLPYLLAWQEAQQFGCDDALLGSAGYLCESARSSLFWVNGNKVCLPDLEIGCLRGVGREALIESAPALGFRVNEGFFSLEYLESCEAVFLISAATGPRSVEKIVFEDETAIQLGTDEDLIWQLRAWWEGL